MGTKASVTFPVLVVILLFSGQSEPALRSAQLMPYLIPTSVHALRPRDVGALSALGLSKSHRSDEINILRELNEILSSFNPKIKSMIPAPRSDVADEAEDLVLALNKYDWKLLLFFVPVDELCLCPGQIPSEVEATVLRVEEALNKLHEKMESALVHVVVWGGQLDAVPQNNRECECLYEGEFDSSQTYRDKAILMAIVQESLDALMQRRQWWSDREDFSVVLQSSPSYYFDSYDSKRTDVSREQSLSKMVTHMWSKLQQPMRTKAIPLLDPSQPYLITQRNSGVQPKAAELRSAAEPNPVSGTTMSCTDTNPSPTVPTSVHALRPGDIKVVAALGDSITAANGVGGDQNNILSVLTQYRGLTFSIGGDENLTSVTTVPNILREFNPSVTGYSTGTGNVSTEQSYLNLAVPGGQTRNLTEQAWALITRMKEDSRIDFENDWKVITVFMGANDLCDSCLNMDFYTAEKLSDRIRDALDILHQEVPRALVNLVELLNIIQLRRLHQDTSLGCPTWLVKTLCGCVLEPGEDSEDLQTITNLNRDYQIVMKNLVESGRYNTRDDFTVVLQPFLRNSVMPELPDGRPDRSFFAADCYHLGQKSHTVMALGLWNNMLEPLNSKTTSVDFTQGISMKCPSESSPYFSTYANSEDPTEPSIPNWGSDFSCEHTAPSGTVPTSVHKLRPGDINVVASVGDSLTAGFGAKADNIFELRNEERGVSWSIGGDEILDNVTTLPNILKKFNPNLYGFSLGRSDRPNGFNMAVSGAKASGIPGQVRDLVEALKTNDKVNFEQDWKLLTLFIGGNDLCQYCQDQDNLSPGKYIGHIRDALDILYKEVPRVMVNFVEIFEIENLRKIKSNTLGCAVLQPNLCPCFLQPAENSDELSVMKRINRELQTQTERLVFGGRYDGREDFTVILQPFFQNTVVPMGTDGMPDLDFFSVDCFHFSERGHAEMAIGLWNNMLEPVGSKQTYNNFTHDRSKIRCPTEENPYIFTLANTLNITPKPSEPQGTTPRIKNTDGYLPPWGAALLTVAGALVGAAIGCLALSYVTKRKKEKKDKQMLMKIQCVDNN